MRNFVKQAGGNQTCLDDAAVGNPQSRSRDGSKHPSQPAIFVKQTGRHGLLWLLLCVLFSCTNPASQAKLKATSDANPNTAVVKETFLYAVKGTDRLFLDKYAKAGMKKPEACVFFMFGGGFVNGQRDGDGYRHYFNALAEAGYTVVSIDYRLGLKNIRNEAFATEEQFMGMLKNAIDMAVDDLYDATNFVLSRKDWGVEPSRMVLSGSSAGAIAVLQAEYELIRKSSLAQKLPEGFNYAGVMAFAGAILSFDGELALNEQTCPLMLFHGNGDSNVPYDKLELGPVGFYGSKAIAERMKTVGRPYYFYNLNNAAHEIANTPMRENTDEMLIFMDKWVLRKQLLFVESAVERIGAPELKKEFVIDDYFHSNFGH